MGELFTADIICYGVPSPGAFQSYLKMLEGRAGKEAVNYAHRGNGIVRGGSAFVEYFDGSREQGTTAVDAWAHAWYGRLVRESCFRCGHHSVRRPGNVTMGDYWGIAGVAPGLEDRWGISCLLANDERGLGLIKSVASEFELFRTSVSDAANPSQPMLSHPPARGERDSFWPSMRVLGDVMRGAISRVKGSEDPSLQEVAEREGEPPMTDFEEIEAGGRYPVVFAAKNRDDDVRRMSSSGGVFHALASYVIGDLGGVVYGCAFDDSLRACHETMEEVERCMGSKYSQSDMGDSIPRVREDLAAGRTVLFTGTPCQVAAVRAACRGATGGSLILADIVCHGVPSPALFQEWLRVLENERGRAVALYEHRPKSVGGGHFERLTWADGSSEQRTRWSEAWKAYFYDNRSLRTSCYRCPYTVSEGRSGDVTIADFWGVEDALCGIKDDLGVSLVLANTPVGLGVLSCLNVDLWEATLADALPRNPMLARPSIYEGERDEVWRGVYTSGLLPTMRHYGFIKSPLRAAASRVKRAVKKMLGR